MDIQVQLLVNGTMVDSTKIGSLPAGGYSYPVLFWTPTTTGTYNITFYAVPKTSEASTTNNVLSEKFIVGAAPSESNWTLVASDPDEGEGLNLKAVSTQQQSKVVYFQVAFHRSWVDASSDIDAAIFVDADRNSRTGLPDHYFTNQDDSIGADYIIIVG